MPSQPEREDLCGERLSLSGSSRILALVRLLYLKNGFSVPFEPLRGLQSFPSEPLILKHARFSSMLSKVGPGQFFRLGCADYLCQTVDNMPEIFGEKCQCLAQAALMDKCR